MKRKKRPQMIRELQAEYQIATLPPRENQLESVLNKIICCDNLELLRKIPNSIVNLVVTSPPYYKQRAYNGKGIGNETSVDEYLDNLIAVFNECVRITKDTGAIVFNIGDKYEDSGLRLIPQRFAIKVIDSGKAFLVNNLTWEKLNPTPRQDRKKLVQSTEPFFIFAKSKNYTFNLNEYLSHLTLLNAAKSKNNGRNGMGKSYFALINNSNLSDNEKSNAKKDLTRVIEDVKSGVIESFRMKIRGIHAKPYGGQPGGRQIQLDNNGFTIIRINGEKLKRDIITSPVESIKNTQHPAIYPLYVVQELIRLLSNKDDIVLDPFVGSGTTCLAAKNLGRNYIGVDIDSNYVDYANNRLKKETKSTLELFL